MIPAAVAGSMVVGGCCLGVGFAISRVLVDKIARLWNWTKGKVAALLSRIVELHFRLRSGLDREAFEAFIMDNYINRMGIQVPSRAND